MLSCVCTCAAVHREEETQRAIGCAGAGMDGVMLEESSQELGAHSDPARTNCKSHQLQRELGWNQPGEGFSGQEGPLGAVTKAFCRPKGPRQVEVSPLCCLWCEPRGKSRLSSWLPGEAVPIPISPALLLPHPWERRSAVLTVLKPSPSHPCTPWAVLT